MLWFEIAARVPLGEVEAVSALMREGAPGGVSVEEPVTILGPEEGFRVRAGEAVVVKAYIPSGELGAVVTEDLRRRMRAAFPAVELVAKPLYEEDWAVSWREFFGPVDYGGRLVIVPSWIEPVAEPGRLVIRLDPGQAFGTGHHETTRLCLAALEDCVRAGAEVLDVGTGSGILAIASVKLGARHVDAVDVDPVALSVARENCGANGALNLVDFRPEGFEGLQPGTYEIIIANISTAENLALLPEYARLAREGNGRVILSGILAVDAVQFRAAAGELGLEFREITVERDWCALVFGR
jgi:ribosomal protein L11 methyltransferase